MDSFLSWNPEEENEQKLKTDLEKILGEGIFQGDDYTDLLSKLSDGRILCKLICTIHDGYVKTTCNNQGISANEFYVEDLSQLSPGSLLKAKQKNIQNFLSACFALGVDGFSQEDLLEIDNPLPQYQFEGRRERIVSTIFWYIEACQQLQELQNFKSLLVFFEKAGNSETTSSEKGLQSPGIEATVDIQAQLEYWEQLISKHAEEALKLKQRKKESQIHEKSIKEKEVEDKLDNQEEIKWENKEEKREETKEQEDKSTINTTSNVEEKYQDETSKEIVNSEEEILVEEISKNLEIPQETQETTINSIYPPKILQDSEPIPQYTNDFSDLTLEPNLHQYDSVSEPIDTQNNSEKTGGRPKTVPNRGAMRNSFIQDQSLKRGSGAYSKPRSMLSSHRKPILKEFTPLVDPELLSSLSKVLPPSTNVDPNEMESMDSEARLRILVIKEIIQTEKFYFIDLQVLVDKYLRKLNGAGILSEKEIGQIFSNIDIILSIHKEINQEINKLQTKFPIHSPQFDIASIFHSKMGEIGPPYIHYCANHRLALETYQICRKEKPTFSSFLNKLVSDSPDLRGLDLRSYIIKPVQRLCKYPLLFKELLKRTPIERVEECKTLQILKDKFEEITSMVDTFQFEVENRRKITEIQNSVAGAEGFHLLQGGRKFIREGILFSPSLKPDIQYRSSGTIAAGHVSSGSTIRTSSNHGGVGGGVGTQPQRSSMILSSVGGSGIGNLNISGTGTATTGTGTGTETGVIFKEYHFFLFNDMLLIAKKRKMSFLSSWTTTKPEKKFDICNVFPLAVLQIKNLPDTPQLSNAFEITRKDTNQQYILGTEDEETKLLWIQDLMKHIIIEFTNKNNQRRARSSTILNPSLNLSCDKFESKSHASLEALHGSSAVHSPNFNSRNQIHLMEIRNQIVGLQDIDLVDGSREFLGRGDVEGVFIQTEEPISDRDHQTKLLKRLKVYHFIAFNDVMILTKPDPFAKRPTYKFKKIYSYKNLVCRDLEQEIGFGSALFLSSRESPNTLIAISPKNKTYWFRLLSSQIPTRIGSLP